tara:strand:- start:635 stop:937 length:303 start_codon:yes stop_codon:yes gene_type:complete
MPANRKYLTQSAWQRFAKISAGILGGFIVATAFHLALASCFSHVAVLITSTFSSFILWAVLLIVAFLAKNGWRIWLIYLIVTLLLATIIYYGNIFNTIES